MNLKVMSYCYAYIDLAAPLTQDSELEEFYDAFTLLAKMLEDSQLKVPAACYDAPSIFPPCMLYS